MKGNIALKGFYFIRKSFMWKIHINPKPEKPDILAAINGDGRGSGAASHSKPEQLVVPALTALLTRPRLSFWNAAACGLGDDGWGGKPSKRR